MYKVRNVNTRRVLLPHLIDYKKVTIIGLKYIMLSQKNVKVNRQFRLETFLLGFINKSLGKYHSTLFSYDNTFKTSICSTLEGYIDTYNGRVVVKANGALFNTNWKPLLGLFA